MKTKKFFRKYKEPFQWVAISAGILVLLLLIGFILYKIINRDAAKSGKKRSIEEGREVPIRMSPSPVAHKQNSQAPFKKKY